MPNFQAKHKLLSNFRNTFKKIIVNPIITVAISAGLLYNINKYTKMR